MYRVAILYTGDCYNKCINSIKYEELKGNIEVVGVGEANPYATSIDGYPFCTITEVLNYGCDYLLIGGIENSFVQIKEMLVQVGVPENRILSLSIFKIPCFDFAQYIRFHEERVSIITCHCWGGLTYHTLKVSSFHRL